MSLTTVFKEIARQYSCGFHDTLVGRERPKTFLFPNAERAYDDGVAAARRKDENPTEVRS